MSSNFLKLDPSPKVPDTKTLANIMNRIHAHAMTMIYLANHRADIEKGDPKVGGHPSACSSALHLLSTLHLVSRNPQDYVACKPHASPTDHAANYLLRLFVENGARMSDERARIAMKNLRHFSKIGEPVFQSYHSGFDPDHWSFLPSGSVGIPPVNAVYLAHAYRMASTHGYKVPEDAHFWSLMGDSEYREGSLAEVLPEAAERELGNVTWILDYNRQSLDGNRILNEVGLGGKDNDRVAHAAEANGWEVLQIRHGAFRRELFAASPDGEALQNVLDKALLDYELQSLLAKMDAKATLEALGKFDKAAARALKSLSESDMLRFLTDLGGHDIPQLIEAFENSKKDSQRPTLIVAHTLKGRNLRSLAKSGNHSAMMSEEEVIELRARYGMNGKDLYKFEHFEADTPEGKYVKARGEWVVKGRESYNKLKAANLKEVVDSFNKSGALEAPVTDSGINLKMVPLAHTQWMLGQISAKYARIADTSYEDSQVKAPFKPLSAQEKALKPSANLLISMAPDVGTSTNLNANMDGRVFGHESEDFETEYGVKDAKTPDIVPHEFKTSRFIRFDIAEGNAMSCMGSYGKMGELAGVPFLPLMTVYDFFLKRALDQLFYNSYWNSSFICVGTPSGVTLSPEGAQHCWKSDIQIANCISWETAFALEFDWVFSDACRRHLMSFVEGKDSPNGNSGRTGVIIRGSTRALEQKEFLKRLQAQRRFSGQSEAGILEATRRDCLEGGYYLVDHRGQPGYKPSENVVHIFAMGSLVSEAILASDSLLAAGIFANVIQVSSSDLLLGNLAEKNGYRHLKQTLGVSGDLYLKPTSQASVSAGTSSAGAAVYPPDQFGPRPAGTLATGSAGRAQLMTLGGRRIPIVSVHDGEPGLLDNLGSVVGTLQRALAVRKHSKSGRPSDVYGYHGIDAASVAKAATAISKRALLLPFDWRKPWFVNSWLALKLRREEFKGF